MPLPVEAFVAFATMRTPRPYARARVCIVPLVRNYRVGSSLVVNYVLSGRKCASARRFVSKSKCVYRS
jgi:hypothetical protein